MDFERFPLLHVDCLQPPNQPTSHIQLVIHFTSFFCCLELKNHLKSSVDFDATTCCFVFLLETKEKSLIFRIELLLFTLSSSVVVAVVSCLKLSSRFIFHTQCTYILLCYVGFFLNYPIFFYLVLILVTKSSGKLHLQMQIFGAMRQNLETNFMFVSIFWRV